MHNLSSCCCYGLVAMFLFIGAIGRAGETAVAPRSSGRPAAVSPAVRNIRQILHGKSDTARLKLLARWQQTTQEADHAEKISALADGLQHRIAKRTFDAVDLRLLSLLAADSSAVAAAALPAFLAAADDRVALIALQGLNGEHHPTDWGQIQSITEQPYYPQKYAVRRAVVAAAEQNGSKPAIDFLIDTLTHAEGQLKYEAACSLSRLTNQNFGGLGADWSAWWQTARDQFEPVPLRDRRSGSFSAPMRWETPVSEFYDVPIYAQKVLFILDRSESMASSVDGEQRIDRARKELEEAILQLPSTTEFNVVAFHDLVEPFAPGLAPATPERKRAAILFAHRLLPELKTACYDALSLGLEDHPNLEAVYFLCDGEPTSGAIVEPSAIVEAITQLNRLKLVSIYTLGIDARGSHEEFLKQLAARNFGEYFLIR